MHSPLGTRAARRLVPAVLGLALALSACAGENLFQLAVVAGGGGPTVDITAPTANLTLAQGAPVQIAGTASAPNGVATAEYTGVFTASGAAAFVAGSDQFQNAPSTNFETTLNAAVPSAPGDVWIIVKVIDGLGEAKADTVKITIS